MSVNLFTMASMWKDNITGNATTCVNETPDSVTDAPEAVGPPQALSMSGFIDAATKDMIIEVVNCYFLPVVFVFGVAGNVVSFVVLLIHSMATSTNVLLLGVTISDLCFLLSMYARKVSCIVAHVDLTLSRTIETALIPNVYMVNRIFNLTTPFLTMLITLERCLAVIFPIKVTSIVTPLRMKVAVVCVFFIATCCQFPFFFIYKINWSTDSQGYSVPQLSPTSFFLANFETITSYNNIILSAVFNYLPMAVVVIATATVLVTLKRSAQWRKISASQGKEEKSSKERKMTSLLMTVVAVYIACYIPHCAVLIANSFHPDTFNSMGGRYSNLFYTINALQLLLYSLNSSSNFVIYMLMSSKFFNTYKRIFLCQKLTAHSKQSSNRGGRAK